MSENVPLADMILQDETAMRWEFLDEEPEACAVVSERMELVYLNTAGRTLTPPEWFTRRCFEVLPVPDQNCAWKCPAITAVNKAEEVTYCEERLSVDGAPAVDLGMAVIPLRRVREDGSKAILLFRNKEGVRDEERFRDELLGHARDLDARIAAHLG